MQEEIVKKYVSGVTLTYTPLGGNKPRFMFVQKDKKGHIVEMGEVYNPVLTEKNINDFEPRKFNHKDGRWMTFYPYPEGQNPFKFIASQSTYRMNCEMGNFRRFYSRYDKPYDDNLTKESGQLIRIGRVYAGKPFGEIVSVDMMGCKHRCQYERGQPYTGEVVYGYGKNNVWRETLLSYQQGQVQPKVVRSIYTRKKLGEPYLLYARQEQMER